MGNLDPEGDVHINEPLQGTGTERLFPRRTLLAIKSFFYNNFQLLFPNEVVTPPDHGAHTGNTRYTENTLPFNNVTELEWLSLPTVVSLWLYYRCCEQILTEDMPPVGYFIAGGLAGVISRTATAPFDRLKVYLIAQTSVKEAAIGAMKSGAILGAVVRPVWPLVEAMKELWRAGGMRSLFAGLQPSYSERCIT